MPGILASHTTSRSCLSLAWRTRSLSPGSQRADVSEREVGGADLRTRGAAAHLDVSVMVDEKILRFQISVYEI